MYVNKRKSTMENDQQMLDEKHKLFFNKSFHEEEQDAYEYVDNLFTKSFQITDNDNYVLPNIETMFKDSLWEIDKLQTLKSELNSVKNCLNNYDLDEWQSHTKFRNSAKNVMIRLRKDIQPEFVTQAWCKFYEIVSSFPLVPVDYITHKNNKRFKSVHLCEAPGAFVASLNHWLKTNVQDIEWDWMATTLNPYYEGNPSSIMIDDDRFLRHTLNHWCFGEDNTGNIMTLNNLNSLIKLSEPRNEILLVTADGSINCMDVPGEQENVVAHLHFCETIAALHILSTGGSFLLKIFTIFECQSVCLLYLLACCFDKISITKPATSKEGNSETYVVCTNFKGTTFVLQYLEEFRKHYEHGPKQAMFSKDTIPHAFIQKIIKCSEFYKTHQCLVIRNNIITFKSDNTTIDTNIKQIQCMVADKYISQYNLKKLISGEIVGKIILCNSISINTYKRAIQGSYNERCEKQHLTPWDQLKEFFNNSNNIKIHMSPNELIKFKFYELPEDLQICFGKIFYKVHSSRFCNEYVLKIQNGINNVLTNMGYQIQFPSIENINKVKENILLKPGYKILTFQYTDTYDCHEIINKICDAFQNLDFSENLILIGYSLLTHLSIGLLYLISHTFHSMEIKLSNDVGLNIILNDFKYNVKVLKYLLDIKEASLNAKENEKIILQVIPTSFLHDCDLSFKIMDINHWVTKSFVDHVSNTLEGKTSSIKDNT